MLFRPWLQENEAYTYRAKELKRLVRTPATLFFAMCRPTFVLIDIVGSLVAAASMCWAVLGLWLAWKVSQMSLVASDVPPSVNQNGSMAINFTFPFMIIIVISYVLNDRLTVRRGLPFINLCVCL